MSSIIDVTGRQVFDSRGKPHRRSGCGARRWQLRPAIVPSGASTGAHEAVELRDGGKAFLGKGVTKAVDFVNTEIYSEIEGLDALDQITIDRTMIGARRTPNKSRLGANAILGVVAGGGQGRRGKLRTAALQICRRAERPHPAGADDEHHQWRRACRQSDRHAGIHDPARGRREHGACGADRLGNLPHAEEGAACRRPQHQCRRRRRLLRQSELGRSGARIYRQVDHRRRYEPGKDVYLGLDCASTEYFQRRQIRDGRRGQIAELGREC